MICEAARNEILLIVDGLRFPVPLVLNQYKIIGPATIRGKKASSSSLELHYSLLRSTFRQVPLLDYLDRTRQTMPEKQIFDSLHLNQNDTQRDAEKFRVKISLQIHDHKMTAIGSAPHCVFAEYKAMGHIRQKSTSFQQTSQVYC